MPRCEIAGPRNAFIDSLYNSHEGTFCWTPYAGDCAMDRASQVALVGKNPPTNVGDIRCMGLIPGSGKSPGGGHGNPFQYLHLENPIDRGALWASL